MQPTILLADPNVRLAGQRFSAPRWRVDAPTRAIGAPAGMHWGRMALAAVALIAVCALGFLRTWPPLATVMSASMAPTINTGDMVVLKKLDGPARVGDIVTVSVPAEARNRFGYPPVVIHRIVRIDALGVVTTKGDAYEKVDPFDVPGSALSTKVVATVPSVGRAFAFLGSSLGLVWLAGGALMLIGMPLLDRYRDGQRRGLDERDDVHTLLQSVTEELALLRVERDRELDAAALQAAEREQFRAAERDRELQAAGLAAAVAQEQLRAVNAAVSRQLEQLPAQIERAIAVAITAMPLAPPPPPPQPAAAVSRPLLGCVPASQWKPPAPPLARDLPGCVPASHWKPPTPDVMSLLGRPAKTTSEVFRLPVDFVAVGSS